MAHEYGSHLRSLPLFSDLDDHEIDAIGRAATDLNIAAGTVVMREGALAHEMLVVRDGTLEVTIDGRHLGTIGPGEMAGEMALLTRTHRIATVTAVTDVKAIHIDGREFERVLGEAPHIAVKMLPILAERAAENSQRPTD